MREPSPSTPTPRGDTGGQERSFLSEDEVDPAPASVRSPAMIGRIPILDVQPVIDCGRWPAKAVPDETFEVGATVFREGHEMLGAGVVLRDPQGRTGPLARLREVTPGTDRYAAQVTPSSTGLWHFRVEAWGDPVAHWWHYAGIKIPRGQDTELMLEEGARLFERALKGVPKGERSLLKGVIRALRENAIPPIMRFEAADAPEVHELLERHPLREHETVTDWHPLLVHRERALFGSWYELFPRSEGAAYDPMGRRAPQSGTFRSAMKRLPAIAEMGFDVVYLPPIHPIGAQFRKGPNNTLHAESHDPGSPWAIGSEDGGHDAIHPQLGGFADFDAFVEYTKDLGMEVALDFALQCSPDHPWVKEHPEWFTTRADGSIAYAENPPKKYQDIYPLNFDNDPEGIYREVERVLRLWMDHGVRIFRVDNPHTKPVAFWERLLGSIAETDPDVLFLAEAFTKPAMMHTLGKIGFHQSYTYFTWRNNKGELEEYLHELSGPASPYMRPNFFVNTPDILHEYLQHGGPPGFAVRAVLAATLSPAWGVYSGYELYENIPVRPGSEEYRDSEKYQYRPRDWEAAEREGRSLAPLISSLNSLRRAHPALRRLRNLRFHNVDQSELICFSKRVAPANGDGDAADLGDVVLVVVNLNPHQVREATVYLDMPALGLDWADQLVVTDELSGESYHWRQANYVRLDPHTQSAHIFTVSRGES
ncbi:MAG: alpha amylase catalytic region [Actinoallomurus sp.]|jgi:starch synthase (maltosyl-transferring)|nr:alpha amylase catalytic region [Actinoallomurus sp.]